MMEPQIMAELKAIREELSYIKEHMVDIDIILTPDEEKMLKESIEEFEQGKTVRLNDLKRDDR